MVLLTITPTIAESLKEFEKVRQPDATLPSADGEPSLDDAAVGKPISHAQVLDLWKQLKSHGRGAYTLESLLKGARVYVPPPPPKPEPSPEFKALMARLRRDEEQRAYERMVRPPQPMETFSQLFPSSSLSYSSALGTAHGFAEVNRPLRPEDTGDDDVTYADVHRQLMLILNFVVSILGVAGTLWVLARWWPTPARLFLTMAGAVLVGIAEVAVYNAYLWHLSEANKKEKKVKEKKEVMQTWVVGAENEKDVADTGKGEGETVLLDKKKGDADNTVRRRS